MHAAGLGPQATPIWNVNADLDNELQTQGPVKPIRGSLFSGSWGLASKSAQDVAQTPSRFPYLDRCQALNTGLRRHSHCYSHVGRAVGALERCGWYSAESVLLCRFEVQGQAATSQEVMEALSIQVYDGRLRKIEEVVFRSSRAVCVAGHYQKSRSFALFLKAICWGICSAHSGGSHSAYAVGVEGDRLSTDPAECMQQF